MTLIEGWLPPTRQNYDILMKLWTYGFPFVHFILTNLSRRTEADENYVVCFCAMGYQLVWHGQNLS